MIRNFLTFEFHKKLVNLIIEEAEIISNTTSPDIIKRHISIINFLIHAQCVTSQELLTCK